MITRIVDATIVTQNSKREVIQGELIFENDRIIQIIHYNQRNEPPKVEINAPDVRVISAKNQILLPGFIQTHVHLCQTSLRNLADDLELLDWLRKVVFIGEANHTYESLYHTALLSIQELLQGGTTTVLTIETVQNTEAIIKAVQDSGIRAIVGKALMDRDIGQPKALLQTTEEALLEADTLFNKYHDADHQRIKICYAPRFVPSCTEKLLVGVRERAKERRAIVHTHASENKNEVALVQKITGKGNIEYLDTIRLLTPNTAVAHCVHTDKQDWNRLADNDAKVLHCPSSNLKLGSGFAPIYEMKERGITIGLGADGAPCNNNLDALLEARLYSLLQTGRLGVGKITAQDALDAITIEGAKVIGLENDIGSLEVGKKADLILISTDKVHCQGGDNPISKVIYSCRSSDVEMVWVDGKLLFNRRN
ncbi:MAG: amidohydrolase family protein [bacterium]|nr:amidohydrolase family protein [bacterium]